MDSILYRLQNWYHTQCQADWHTKNGIDIRSINTPGWSVEIDLLGTPVENKLFTQQGHRVDATDWVQCWVDENIFYGTGDPGKLSAILDMFLHWVEE